MYVVYVLQDDQGNFYKGMTNDLERRLKEHLSGGTKTTRRMNNLTVVYREEYLSRIEARKREIYFKSAAGRRFLKNKLNSGV